MELNPTAEDYALLWQQNPLAEAQLKVIILQRMYDQQVKLNAEMAKKMVSMYEANKTPETSYNNAVTTPQ